ncbi:hypothetical protein [Paenibacillus sp. NPDC058071]|uniref:hypothetical protein n=1 Tax=Paenibacillus sp. NPDC058071 TaxID=3346326 RepID=UPI0036DAD027
MYKLMAIILFMSVWITLLALQTDEELSMKQLFEGKRAVNRAAHAAAQQLDRAALADGVLRIDEAAARLAAEAYLRANLRLDANGQPLPGSSLRDKPEIAVFDIINDSHTFPYRYTNDLYSYEATLKRPGVVIILKMDYPRVFEALPKIGWAIKGVAEPVIRY